MPNFTACTRTQNASAGQCNKQSRRPLGAPLHSVSASNINRSSTWLIRTGTQREAGTRTKSHVHLGCLLNGSQQGKGNRVGQGDQLLIRGQRCASASAPPAYYSPSLNGSCRRLTRVRTGIELHGRSCIDGRRQLWPVLLPVIRALLLALQTKRSLDGAPVLGRDGAAFLQVVRDRLLSHAQQRPQLLLRMRQSDGLLPRAFLHWSAR
nr:MAG TPA: hypothetical protein [Caudoviricetes sp.]